jgi:tetratricopeptide (TPR) repeat protein
MIWTSKDPHFNDPFQTEAPLESVVAEVARVLFGPNTAYVQQVWPMVTKALLLLSLAGLSCSCRESVEQVAASYREQAQYQEFSLQSPLQEAVFPPEIAPCTFAWRDPSTDANAWLLQFEFGDSGSPLRFLSREGAWTPAPADWERVKQRSREQAAKLTVLGFRRGDPTRIMSRGRVTFRTSKDEVGAPLFYREVNLPFMSAVKDPSRIRWRFGSVGSPEPPPVVLEGLPVCGNCHSFSADGRTLGMDVDYANDKGSYVVTPVEKEMTLASSDIMSWCDYRREDHLQTFGLLSQVSPDGADVISTVHDKSVFVGRPDLAFSQLFFPIKGILVVYHRPTRAFQALPGADDPQYVQSNPTWSPDGKEILFARAPAYQLKSQTAEGKLVLSEDECAEFLREGKSFLFDLYRVPFNQGHGGQPQPVPGASHNGKSNFFPRYSPDGKWIVYCQARSYMLLQPDSELFIIPAAGGEPRRLRCNTARMNSWHSWSPNGRWLVFSSKANSPYTQLWLTHIDEQGESTPPVVLAQFTAPDRAANIPEFVNTRPDAIRHIQERFLDDYSLIRAAYVLEVNNELEAAIAKYEQALALNPRNVHAHQHLGFLLYHHKRQFQEGITHTREALRLDPNDGCAHYDLGMALKHQGEVRSAVTHLAEAVRLLPSGFDRRYNPVDMRRSLGETLLENGQPEQAIEMLNQALSLNTTNAATHYSLALALAARRQTEACLQHYAFVRATRPDLDISPYFHLILAANYAEAGQRREAVISAQKALELAQAAGDTKLIQTAREYLDQYRAAQ